MRSDPVADTVPPADERHDTRYGPGGPHEAVPDDFAPDGTAPDEAVPDDPEAPASPVRGRAARRPPGRASRQGQKWTRLVHVYASMICFVVVLFFAATGITLNHPTWVLGGSGSHRTITGTLPSGWRTGTTVDWLRVAEYFRNNDGVSGSVGDYRSDDTQGSITFKAPGYEADAFIDVEKGTYELTIDSQGLLAVMNDLHKGRNTGSSWKWLIDVAGGFLVLVSLSGILLQMLLRKRRRTTIATAAAGAAIVGVMIARTVA